MYHMEHLLNLLTMEKAEELRFRAGSPPLVVSEDQQRAMEGPPLTTEELMQLLHSLAGSRHMRDLRAVGAVQFVYAAPCVAPFLVRARMENGEISFDVS